MTPHGDGCLTSAQWNALIRWVIHERTKEHPRHFDTRNDEQLAMQVAELNGVESDEGHVVHGRGELGFKVNVGILIAAIDGATSCVKREKAR